MTRKDRAIGALLGLAVGDALGTTLEFTRRDSREPLTEMRGGGPFHLPPGHWTDDTSMALCLADSILACGGLDQRDLMLRFCRWRYEGENSCTGFCFDIGRTTQKALELFQDTGNPVSASADPMSAGNGSLMRLAPVPIFWHRDRIAAAEAARQQSATTHGAEASIEACAFFAHLLLDAINGEPRENVLAARSWAADVDVDRIARGSWRTKERQDIQSSGYVIHTLEAALWSVARAANFRDAVLTAANLGEDADTVAAVTGQLAGALWGESGIPQGWVGQVAWSDKIRNLATRLFEHSAIKES